jgi:hypothetical protein
MGLRVKVAISALTSILIGSVSSAAMAQAAAPAGAVDKQAACAKLARNYESARRFAQIESAPTTIISAQVAPAGGSGGVTDKDHPELCRVEGQIAPTVGFLLRMPTTNWNGKILMGGCGGPCGMYLADRTDPALVRGYAVVVTDMGHKGSGWMFAENNPQQMIDFGYRATHVTAVAAKEVVASYYGQAPKWSYFIGCSTGGRQALVSAQRFPEDFNGIVGGAPPWMQTGHQPYVGVWGSKANIRADGTPIMFAPRLQVIHKAVMAACDKLDGLADGVLQDPRKCTWDPGAIQCASGPATDACLSAEEVGAVRKIYDGPRNSKGVSLYPGLARGSELDWTPLIVGPPGKPGIYWESADTTLHHLAFNPSRPASWEHRNFDFDRDPALLQINDPLFHHTNPDLSAFKAAGGKLILFHGWNDNNLIPPQLAIDYYEKASRTMGGEKATQDFFRLFMMPAMGHCRYGPGGGEADWLTALENWVEKGQAPEQILAHHMVTEPYPTAQAGAFSKVDSATFIPRHPLPAGSYDRVRPVYPYPAVARYGGRGDPAAAASWKAVR